MGREPTYGDPDNPWGDEDKAALLAETDTSGVVHIKLLKDCWAITGGRKKFRKAAEKRRWLKVDKRYGNKIPKNWVASCMEWAKEKNIERTVIVFPSLLNLILNVARMTDWLAQNVEEGVAVTINLTAQDMFGRD